MPTQWLTDIPQEIRIMIYHEIFNGLRVLPFELMKTQPERDQDRHAGFTLFLTNKAVYTECKPIFRKETVFRFEKSWRLFYPWINAHAQSELVKSRREEIRYIEKISCKDIGFVNEIMMSKASWAEDGSSLGLPALLKEIHIDHKGCILAPMYITLGNIRYVLPQMKGIQLHYKIHSVYQGYHFCFHKLLVNEAQNIVTVEGENLGCLDLDWTEMGKEIVRDLRLSEDVKIVWEC